MSEFRSDPLFGGGCIVSQERAAPPTRIHARDVSEAQGPCALCPGNEGMTPPEITRLPEAGRWETRVFSDRYPVLSLEAEVALTDLDQLQSHPGHAMVPGFGVHEIVVESPNHLHPFWMQDPERSVTLFSLLQSRIKSLYGDRRILLTQIFKNHRPQAGATLEHPHFQLLGLPFLPAPMAALLAQSSGSCASASSDESCKVCRWLKHELKRSEGGSKTPDRLLFETSKFVALADFAPSFNYQFSIYPKVHVAGLDQATRDELEDFAHLCSLVIGRYERILGDFAMNLVIYTQPNPDAFAQPKELGPWQKNMHWFMRVMPRIGRRTGVELSTHIPVVHVAPEHAARAFREKGI